MSVRSFPLQKSAANAGVGRLAAVLKAGLASTDVKRTKDGDFVLSENELKALMEADGIDEVPLPLRDSYNKVHQSSPLLVEVTRYGQKIYLLQSKRTKEAFLRFSAVSSFYSESVDRFYDDAGSGGYGDVEEGDWEAAGITMEDSLQVRVSNEMLQPLKYEWDSQIGRWITAGVITVDEYKDFITEKGENHGDFEERFQKTYEDSFWELRYGNDTTTEKLSRAVDKFVKEMLSH